MDRDKSRDLQDGSEHQPIEQARANDSSFLQISKGEELHWSKEFLPSDEGSKADYSDHYHDNDVYASPLIFGG